MHDEILKQNSLKTTKAMTDGPSYACARMATCRRDIVAAIERVLAPYLCFRFFAQFSSIHTKKPQTLKQSQVSLKCEHCLSSVVTLQCEQIADDGARNGTRTTKIGAR